MTDGGAATAAGERRVEVGVVRGAYGLKGWAHVVPHANDAAALKAAHRWWLIPSAGRPTGLAAERAVEVEAVRRHGDGLVVKWQGIDVPEQAEALRGALIEVERAAFPPLGRGEVYWVDLLGARVLNRAGVELGRVAGVRNNGAQDLMEVAPPEPQSRSSGATLLIPMVETFIDSIDARAGVVQVDWDPGWS